MRVLALLFVTSTFTAANPHLQVRGITSSETVTPGSTLTVTFDITPARRIHVYAPGADYEVISLALDLPAGVTADKVAYPPSEMYYFEPLDEHVPVYQKPFKLEQQLTIGREALKGKETLTLTGKLQYQACDDKVCFKPNAIPFKFELKVEGR
jgi:DsbC/DsbD-like thiol-disulfide interchange protein